jgi:hypothetical protein
MRASVISPRPPCSESYTDPGHIRDTLSRPCDPANCETPVLHGSPKPTPGLEPGTPSLRGMRTCGSVLVRRGHLLVGRAIFSTSSGRCRAALAL